jgi:hypothetical protein
MNEKAETYRHAAQAARAMAFKATDETAKATWLKHAAEWEQLAKEAERSNDDDKA